MLFRSVISMIISITTLFYLNRLLPTSKQEMIEIARSHHCPLRLSFKYGDDISYYDHCISLLKDDFSKLSNLEKTDVALVFILHGKLDGGASVSFLELIAPFKEAVFRNLDSISDIELQNKFSASPPEIFEYHRTLNHYKSELYNRTQKSP